MLLTQRICKFIKDIITLQNYNIYIYSVNQIAQMLIIIFNQNVIYRTSASFHQWKKNKQDVNSVTRR